METVTCSRQERAASRYFFTFLVHAEDMTLKTALATAGSLLEIALQQDLERAPIALSRASVPYLVQNYSQQRYII